MIVSVKALEREIVTELVRKAGPAIRADFEKAIIEGDKITKGSSGLQALGNPPPIISREAE